MTKSILQLNREKQRLRQRLIATKSTGRNSLKLQVELDTAIKEYKELVKAQQSEDDEIKEIVEQLEEDSIFNI